MGGKTGVRLVCSISMHGEWQMVRLEGGEVLPFSDDTAEHLSELCSNVTNNGFKAQTGLTEALT